ncbi:MAG: prolyl oligopeptidase family serine peptidase [Chitinophagaceae bacterium]
MIISAQKVSDPYRWLEDDKSAETAEWVTEQNKVTQNYLSKIPYRAQVRKRLEEMWNYPKYSSPRKEGEYYYYYKNDGLQNQSVLYRQKGLSGTPEVFIDPNKMSKDGTAAVGSPAFSKNKKYAAYMIAQAGSDWQDAYVIDVNTKQQLTDKVQWIKFSGLSWKGNDGFYYSRYPEPDEKSKLSKQNQFHKIYYHKLGTAQSSDMLVYEDKEHPLRNVSAGITEDERFLIINISEGTSGKELWIKDLKNNQQDLTLLIQGFNWEANVIDNDGDRILVRTNADAPNYQVVSIDPKKPSKENWQTIIPTRTKLLQGVGKAGGKLFVSYLEDASSRIYQTNYKGILEKEIKLPGIGSAGGFGGYKEDKEIFFTYSSYNYPPAIFRYNITTGKTEPFRKNEVKIDAGNYQTVQSFFTSKDGAKVPMFITYKKGLKLDGNNPTLIYGYGGFNIPLTPGFSISNAFFLEQGGVYAVVNLRGGNEYGEEWHKAGMLLNKQNVFNDLIAAAEFLIKANYTNPQKLAVQGEVMEGYW